MDFVCRPTQPFATRRATTDRPDVASASYEDLDRAEVELERRYRVPSFAVARG
jgi:hypothetical protein